MQRLTQEMLERMQPPGNPVPVSLASTDFDTITSAGCAGRKVVAYSATAGSVLYADFINDYNETVSGVALPAGDGLAGCQNIIKIKKTGTDATGINVWTL
jgi:hypothetical protein